jgi:hypothetical protein
VYTSDTGGAERRGWGRLELAHCWAISELIRAHRVDAWARLRARLVAYEELNQALESQEAVDWIPGPSHFFDPHARQSILHTSPGDTSESSVFTGPASGGRNVRLRLYVWGRSVRRRVVSSHTPLLPLTAQPLLSLSSHSSPPNRRTVSLPPPTTAPTEEALLPCHFLAASSPLPRIIGEQASSRISTAACEMSVSTLNSLLVYSVSLHDVRRRALDDMHSG